jgi:hypothetical protein
MVPKTLLANQRQFRNSEKELAEWIHCSILSIPQRIYLAPIIK